MKHNTKKLVLSGLFLAIGLVLPFLTGQIPEIGNMISRCTFPSCCAASSAALPTALWWD